MSHETNIKITKKESIDSNVIMTLGFPPRFLERIVIPTCSYLRRHRTDQKRLAEVLTSRSH